MPKPGCPPFRKTYAKTIPIAGVLEYYIVTVRKMPAYLYFTYCYYYVNTIHSRRALLSGGYEYPCSEELAFFRSFMYQNATDVRSKSALNC